ncbi:conjugal transfer protein [Bacillus sp. EB600]|uniref:conjugal transfer protein n=1 Tax=Bacillus sp. EB600 TaxID=2806345 RepID=UPI00210BD07C|nr:conjugal transfer protein [Bacillus sp. EB600]MCQ6281094.1 conjugal transfer protein [Bacillus sp. EB600]
MKKREYPKTVLRKKLIKYAFWTGFVLVLFLSIVAIVRVGNATAKDNSMQQVDQKVNHAASEGAQSFAQNFASQYFNWQNTDEGRKNRMERLQPYLAKGLNEQAGLVFDGMEWNSRLTKSQVWNVEETGKDTALITLRVQHILKKLPPPDPAAVAEAQKNNTEPPKATEESAGPYEKDFVIPIKTDGKSFVVYKIPYFVAPAKKPQITSDSTIDENSKIQDPKLQEEITSSLNTFFKVYTTGTQEELSYYVKGNEIQTMTGIITFKKVKNTVIKASTSSNEYQVYANVIFQENQSKAQVMYPYQLMLVKQDNRWFVKEMKNQ